MNRNSLLLLVLVLAAATGIWLLFRDPAAESPSDARAGSSTASSGIAPGTAAGSAPASANSAVERTQAELDPTASSLAGAGPAAGSAEVTLVAVDHMQHPLGSAWASAAEDFLSDLDGGMSIAMPGFPGESPAPRHATDAQGRVRIAVPAGKPLRLEIGGTLHETESLSLQPLAAGEHLDLGKVALLAGSRIAGHVLDPSGNAVHGARVSLQDASTGSRGFAFRGGRSADTDADGAFSFDGVTPGAYLVEAEAHGFAPAREANGTRVEAKPGVAVADALLRLRPGRAVIGMVTDQDRRPIAGAEVFLRSALHGGFALALPGGLVSGREPDAVTDSAGRFTLRGVDESATARVSARASGFALGWSSLTATAAEVLITLKPALRLGGVAQHPDGAPAAGLAVRLERVEDEEDGFNFRSLFDDHHATTDAFGRFMIEGLDPGVWEVVARTAASSSAGARVSLEQDVNDYLLRLEVASVLAVQVLRAGEDAPVPDATVVLTPAPEESAFDLGGGHARREVRIRAGGPGGPRVELGGATHREQTDARGTAAFADLPQGRYRMSVAAEGCARHETVVLRERGSQEIGVVLLSGADLLVRVEDGAGLPLPDVNVVAKPNDPALAGRAIEKTLRTDDSGRALFAGLPTGVWAVDYRAAEANDGFRFLAQTLGGDAPAEKESHSEVPAILVAGAMEEVVLRAAALCIPLVSVTRRGTPIAGAEVRTEEVESASPFPMPRSGGERTDANGRVRLQPVEPGEYELVVNPGNGLPERREKVSLAAGTQQIEIEVRGGRISGVALADGRTPSNAIAHLEAAPAEAAASRGRGGRRGAFISITATDDGGGSSGAVDFGGPAATRVQVDGSGDFVFEEVPPGEYVVRVSAHGFAPWTSERIVLQEEQTRDVGTAQLVSGGVVRGINRRAEGTQSGSRFAGGMILLMDASGNNAGFAQTAPDGTYEFRDLSGGAYTLLIPPGYTSEPIAVKVGQTTNFDIPKQ